MMLLIVGYDRGRPLLRPNRFRNSDWKYSDLRLPTPGVT